MHVGALILGGSIASVLMAWLSGVSQIVQALFQSEEEEVDGSEAGQERSSRSED